MGTASRLETENYSRTNALGSRIRSLSIIGGFLDGARFEFAAGLNCIIGARGAGKTTVLELIRFAFDALPSRETAPAERRRVESLIEKNLGGGRVELTIETKDGLSYVVTRSMGEEPRVMTEDRKATGISIRSSGIFRVDIYSQNEVESIADQSVAQLSLLDNFEAERVGELNTKIRRVQSTIDANASQLLPLRQRIDSLDEELETLPAVQERLRQFTCGDCQDGQVIDRAHVHKSLRDREQRAVAGIRQSLQEIAGAIASLRGRVTRSCLSLLFDGLASSKKCNGNTSSHSPVDENRDNPNVRILSAIQEQVTRCGTVVDHLVEQSGQELAGILSEIDTASRALHNAHDEQEVAFRKLIEKHEHAKTQSAERIQLERRRNDLVAKHRELRQLQEELRQLHVQRTELTGHLKQLQEERFTIRESVAQRVNAQLAPAIRVSVEQLADPTYYRRLLEELLRTARVRHLVVAQKLADAIWPAELAAIARAYYTTALVNRAGLTSDQAEKAIAALSEPHIPYRLEAVELLDLPRIELKDGDAYKDSVSLSTGQKVTTILPILLLDSENPLLVDQPEDNLDNRFVFETIVESIRKVKAKRQLIFVTHNPNIPVLGDAERVFVLDSNGAVARTVNEGTVDEVKSHIVTLLEGGEDAFKARKSRYAY